MQDFEAFGWVSRFEFAGSSRWSLTEAGRARDERLLAVELAARGAVAEVVRVHAAFLPLNARFQEAVTCWRLHLIPGDPMASNDHTDVRWDDRVLDELGSLGRRLAVLGAELRAVLARFDGYAERYRAAFIRVSGRVSVGDPTPARSQG